MGVAKVMKPDAWQSRLAHKPLEGVGEDLGMDRRAVFVTKDVVRPSGVWTSGSISKYVRPCARRGRSCASPFSSCPVIRAAHRRPRQASG